MQKQILLIIFFVVPIMGHAQVAANDSINKKNINRYLSVGLFGTQNVIANSIYGPGRVSQMGVQASYNSFELQIGPAFINRTFFEKHNYSLGSRDQRKIPLSGFYAGVYFVKKAYSNKLVHFTFGLQYIGSTVYGGWTSVKTFNAFTYDEYSISRVVNFEDKFYQFDIASGITFSQKNKLGFTILAHLGQTIQNSENSHFNFNVKNSAGYYDLEPKSKKKAQYGGLSVKLFYNFIYKLK